MDRQDIIFSRLKLLIIMVNSFLEDCPLGKYRQESMESNAAYVFKASNDLKELIIEENYNKKIFDEEFEHVFLERIKFLALVSKNIAQGHPMGDYRKEALKNNLNFISNMIKCEGSEKHNFLKVA
ncbi:MAG: hypothetical protein HQK76_04080 [Desulfobacterales bacterium]|nr:hypothetical protein [Desulfobacterales bacterium]